MSAVTVAALSLTPATGLAQRNIQLQPAERLLKRIAAMNKRYLKGLTLAELLIAAAILAFVLSGLLLLFINCSLLNEANRNLTVAMTHAQLIMEEIRNQESAAVAGDLAAIETQINNGVWDLDALAISSAPYNLAALKNEYIDTAVTTSGGSNPLGISITVTWTDRRSRNRQAILQTLMADYQ